MDHNISPNSSPRPQPVTVYENDSASLLLVDLGDAQTSRLSFDAIRGVVMVERQNELRETETQTVFARQLIGAAYLSCQIKGSSLLIQIQKEEQGQRNPSCDEPELTSEAWPDGDEVIHFG